MQGALGLALRDFLARLDTYTLVELVPDAAKFRTALERAQATAG